MPIIIKLVGYLPDKQFYEIRDNFVGVFSIELIHKLLLLWEFTPDDISKIKFIMDSEQLKSYEQKFEVSATDIKIIFVFTQDQDVRSKLCTVFMREGHVVQASQGHTQEITEKKVDAEISQPIPIPEETRPNLNPEIINEINLKAINLFQDSDFKKLIGIYINRPELFNTVLRYIQHGNIVKELKTQTTLDQLTDDQREHYSKLLEQVRGLDLQVSDDLIMIKLIKYSGHLNLAVREILYELHN